MFEFFSYAALSLSLILFMNLVYRAGVDHGKRVELRDHLKRAAEAEATETAFPEAGPGDDDDEVDVCLKPGTRVVCNLSDATHTHGVLIGFAMGPTPDGPMLAIVDVGGGAPMMPIDVDQVDPMEGGPPVGYRDNANQSELN